MYSHKNKLKSSRIEIEYENISKNLNSHLIQEEDNENDNFNVYFMEPDLKYKTLTTSTSRTSQRIKKLNQNKNEQNNEKEFKLRLIKKLKSLKINQPENDKIPLNFASKIKREESIRSSLKNLVMRQSQYDPKKELLYYKAYFRFWKRKCKFNKEKINKKIIKKDKNIRITTVIYRAEKPKTYKNYKIKEESKNEDNERKNEYYRK